MEDIKITYDEIYRYIIYANIVFGVLFGSLSLIVGMIRKKSKYAYLGFALAVVGGSLAGIFLSYPITAVFLWLIVRDQKPAASDEVVPAATNPDSSNI